VASVIAVVTLVNGANVYVATKINHQGADVFTISQSPAFTTSYKEYLKNQKRKIISLDEYRAIQAECSLCVQVGALQSTTGSVKYGNDSNTGTQIRGYTALMPEMQNLNIVEGRGYTQADEDHAAHVAIIGADIEENLLKLEDPIGKEIRVDGVPYTVIGLGEKQGKTLGQSQDNWVGVPLTAYQKAYGTAKTLTIYAKAPSGAQAMQDASDQARLLMRGIRHDRAGEDDSFSLETSSALAGDQEHRRGGDCDCGNLTGGGRRGDYEHHAGECDRADARDRRAQGARRQARRCAGAVPDGEQHPVAGGRSIRRGAGGGRCAGRSRGGGLPCDRGSVEHICGAGGGFERGLVLWRVSGEEGSRFGSDCCVKE